MGVVVVIGVGVAVDGCGCGGGGECGCWFLVWVMPHERLTFGMNK